METRVLDQEIVETWLDEFVRRLREVFGERLRFVGHHGSWARGEAAPESDIDTMVILDRIEPPDLVGFRAVIESMPDGGKAASGLLTSVPEMRALPRSGLMQYFWGCKVLHGSMEGIVERPTERDLLEDVRAKASTHLLNARHYLLFPHDLSQKVHNLRYPFKECAYALQQWVLVQSGEFVARKDDLLRVLDEEMDRAVVEVVRAWRQSEQDRTARPAYYLELLEKWCRSMLSRLPAQAA
jgi:hypothetical protein